MSKAENYIKRQTARRVISLIIKDVDRLGDKHGIKGDTDTISDKLEIVRRGLIGT